MPWLKRFLGLEGSSDLLDFDSPNNYGWGEDSGQHFTAAVAPTEIPPTPAPDIYVWSDAYSVVGGNFSMDIGPDYFSEQVSLWGFDSKDSGISMPGLTAWQTDYHSYGWSLGFTEGQDWFAESYSQYDSRSQESGVSTPDFSVIQGTSVWGASSFSVFQMPGYSSTSQSESNGTSAWSDIQVGNVGIYAGFGQFHQASSTTFTGEGWYSSSSQVEDTLWNNQGIETPSFGRESSMYADHFTYDGLSISFGQDGTLQFLSESHGESNLLEKSSSLRIGDSFQWSDESLSRSHGDSFAVWQGGFMSEHDKSTTSSWENGVSTPNSGFEKGGSITRSEVDTHTVFDNGPLVGVDTKTDTFQFDFHQSGWENTLGGQLYGYKDVGGFATETTQTDHFADGSTSLLVQYSAGFHSESFGTPSLLSPDLGIPQNMAQLVGAMAPHPADHGLMM